MGRDYDRISIVSAIDIIEEDARLEIPMSVEVLKAAERVESEQQLDWVLGDQGPLLRRRSVNPNAVERLEHGT